MKRALVVAALALVLTACGSEGAPSGPVDPPAPVTSATTAAPDPMKACDLVFGRDDGASVMDRIPPALTSIGASVTQEQIDEMLDIQATIRGAADIADTKLAAALTALNVPFTQFSDVIRNGGGDINMDTANVMSDLTATMQLCVDAGYSVAP